MDNRIEKAIASFGQGFNCAQAVLSAFADLLALDEQLAKRLTAGLGAGFGRLQGTCGAVSGAVLVLGGMAFDPTNIADSKELTYRKTQEFIFDFAAKHGTTCCLDLLGVDLRTEEGQKTFKEHNYIKTKCEQYIIDACQLLLAKYLKP